MPIITMPKLSDTMVVGTIARWKKKQGDTIEAGDILAEVETDKATMEMESFDEGILTEIYIQEGQKVEVGQRIARVGDEVGHRGQLRRRASIGNQADAYTASRDDTAHEEAEVPERCGSDDDVEDDVVLARRRCGHRSRC